MRTGICNKTVQAEYISYSHESQEKYVKEWPNHSEILFGFVISRKRRFHDPKMRMNPPNVVAYKEVE